MSRLTVEGLINDRKVYSEAIIEATKELARSKPWQGTIAERQDKLRAYHVKLCAAYGIEIDLEFVGIADTVVGDVRFNAQLRRIQLIGKCSIINYLHAFTRARGTGKREAYAWSLNLFKRYFPRSFERAEKIGPNLYARGTSVRLEALRESMEERETEGDVDADDERDETGEL